MNINRPTYNGIVTADVFTYDELNRLRKDLFYYHNGSSFTNTDDKYGNQYTYDANGNITTLQRKSLLPTTGAVSVMDNLTYNYANQNSDNKLTSLSETSANADFTDDLDGGQIPNNYTYDASGNLTGDDAEKLQIQWNAKGKVTQVTDNSTTPSKIITFEYDANGNRVKKTVDIGSTNCADNNVTYYVYSEKGTVLATYKRKGCFETAMPIVLADHTIQSNQRMGLRNYPQTGNTVQLDNVTQNNTQGYSSRELFRKHYELSDHLGNVRAVISDAKWSYNGIMTPHIISYTNYYPFGMAQPGRNWSSGGYRFGYNGQEKTDEVSGQGNHYTAEFWEYDSRSGRRWNLDPRPNVSMSQYSTFAGNPIMFSDYLGDSVVIGIYGEVIHRDVNDKDNRVFLLNKDNLTFLGEIGKKIDISKIMPELLKKNQEYSEKHLKSTIQGAFDFKELVQTNGVWDLKNNKETIFGIAWDYDKENDDKNGMFTKFLWGNHYTFSSAADVGNFHAGYVGKYAGGFPGFSDNTLLMGAGFAEGMKHYGNSDNLLATSSALRLATGISSSVFSGNGNVVFAGGDNYVDNYWNKEGMNYAKSIFQKSGGSIFKNLINKFNSLFND